MKTQFYLTERQQILVNSLSPADRDQLADYIEYAISMADPKVNPGGRLPEGSLATFSVTRIPGCSMRWRRWMT